MKPAFILAALLVLALAAWPPPAHAQGSIVDTQMEVTTALVQSSLTIEAVKKADDARCRELQARIDALSAQVKVGKARQADLTAAKEALVARLGETDGAYKAEIAAFRGAVTDIASTPEGLGALARFNSGDQVGALAILDKLQQADEAARQRATDIGKAVGERRIASLAEEARREGKVDRASVISRYVAITKLDPDVLDDWSTLANLYLRPYDRPGDYAQQIPAEQTEAEIQDLDRARSAAQTAIDLAKTDQEKAWTLFTMGKVLYYQGDMLEEHRYYLESLRESPSTARVVCSVLSQEHDDADLSAADKDFRQRNPEYHSSLCDLFKVVAVER